MLLNLADSDCDFSNDFWPVAILMRSGKVKQIAVAKLLKRKVPDTFFHLTEVKHGRRLAMQLFHYDLKLMFVAITNVCALAWGLADATILAFPLAIVTASVSFALYGVTIGKPPIALGALGGFAGATVLTVLFFVNHGVGYFFYTGAAEYFEDGAFTELVIFPVLFIVVWGGIGALTGMICGVGVLVVQKSLSGIDR